MQPFWQQPADNGARATASPPPALSLVQGEQPPSNRSQAHPPYRVPQLPPGRAEAEAKIAARRAATMVDGKAPQITGVRARQPRCRRHMCSCAGRVLDARFCVVTVGDVSPVCGRRRARRPLPRRRDAVHGDRRAGV